MRRVAASGVSLRRAGARWSRTEARAAALRQPRTTSLRFRPLGFSSGAIGRAQSEAAAPVLARCGFASPFRRTEAERQPLGSRPGPGAFSGALRCGSRSGLEDLLRRPSDPGGSSGSPLLLGPESSEAPAVVRGLRRCARLRRTPRRDAAHARGLQSRARSRAARATLRYL